MANKVKVTLVKSRYGRLKKHQACVAGLGLRRINHSVIVEDTPENRGTGTSDRDVEHALCRNGPKHTR